jgi:hypothetical protein
MTSTTGWSIASGSVCSSWLTAVRFELAHDQLEGRRLSGPVAADQADALARLDGELGVAQNELVAEFERDVVEAKQWHGQFREIGVYPT